MFFRKGGLKICNKFTGEHPCRSTISIKLHTANLQENTHAEATQLYCKAYCKLYMQSNFLKLHFGMSALLQICCRFPEHFFLTTPREVFPDLLHLCFILIALLLVFFQFLSFFIKERKTFFHKCL